MLNLRKTKSQKGITLIALIITIVILLILAVTAIDSIQNDDIIGHTKNAVEKYNSAVQNEQERLDDYLNYLNNLNSSVVTPGGTGNQGGSGEQGGTEDEDDPQDPDEEPKQTVTTVKNEVISTISNTVVYDEYGNKIVVPAGFKIVVDFMTNNADTVPEGIVIEDGTNGNQFVWIPVGKIYTNVNRTEYKTINLGRYSNYTATSGAYIPAQIAANYGTATTISPYYTEDTTSNHNSSYGNAIARNIGNFITSATTNGGYYLGRFEAGDSSKTAVSDRTGTSGTSTSGALVCKGNQVPYNWITQPDASSKCKSMYPNGYKADGTGTFSSDLVNSYAWDTAIIFIQTFGTKSNSSSYSGTIGLSSTSGSVPQKTGTNKLNATSATDEQLNIYDMAGNCNEWSTETYNNTDCCVYRGGAYSHGSSYPSYRYNAGRAWSEEWCAFRPVIYVGI